MRSKVLIGVALTAICSTSTDAQVTSFGTAGPGASGIAPSLEMSSFPYAGLPTDIVVRGPANTSGLLIFGTSNTQIGGAPLPLNLAPLGVPGCQLLTDLALLLPILTDNNGDAKVTLEGNTSWGTIFLQAFVADAGPNTLGGMTQGLQVQFQPVPSGSDPIVSSFSPIKGTEGGMVTFYGANFGTDLSDLLFVVAGAEELPFRPVSMTPNSVTAKLLPFGTMNATSGPIKVRRGMGALTTLPNIGGATFLAPAFAICIDAANPGESSTLIDFEVPSVQGALSDCAEAVADSTYYDKTIGSWTLNAGDLVYQLPGQFCPQDRLYVSLVFQRCLPGGGAIDYDCIYIEEIEVPSFVSPCDPTSANTVLAMMNFAIATGFNNAGIPVDTISNSTDNTITVRATSGAGTICYGYGDTYITYGPTTLHSFAADAADGFTSPTATTLSPDLAAYLASIPATSQNFDSSATNQPFAHSFVNIPDNARAAALIISVRPNGDAYTNDSISLCVTAPGTGQTFEWGIALSQLPEYGGSYNGPATICLDLAKLPTVNGPVNLLECLCPPAGGATGTLDIYIQDDTGVDYATLDVRVCGS